MSVWLKYFYEHITSIAKIHCNTYNSHSRKKWYWVVPLKYDKNITETNSIIVPDKFDNIQK